MSTEALKTAIAVAGGQSALARKLGVRQPSVWYWLRKAKAVPAEHVLAIERATGGEVTRHDLRPDLYPAVEAERRGSADRRSGDDRRAEGP